MDSEHYMRLALAQAKKAASLGEVPIGCVIVYDGPKRGEKLKYPEDITYPRIIGRGYNRRNTDATALAHAEITAIKKACKVLGDWRLEDCTLYVTLEPCPMCAGAIVQARIPRVVIGCMNPKAGCAGSVLDMLHVEGFNHQVEVTTGVMGSECSGMLKRFFLSLRQSKANQKQ